VDRDKTPLEIDTAVQPLIIIVPKPAPHDQRDKANDGSATQKFAKPNSDKSGVREP
jgi:hypothetical protein